MLENKFEVFDDARDFVARTRPIFVEKHDFSAKLFKNRETGEPLFAISAKGEHRFDIYRILGGIALFFFWLFSLKIYFGIRRSRKKKRKAAKKAAKIAKNK